MNSISRMPGWAFWLVVSAAAACRQSTEDPSASPKGDSIAIEPMGTRVAAACFRSPHSVLLGPPTSTGQQGKGPGWVGVELPRNADSGWAKIVEPGSKAFHARWLRDSADSVAFTAGDDFLRVQMRLAVSDSLAIGSVLARSDATLERDAAGRMADLERRWTIRATRASCDSMPAGWNP